MQNLLDTYGYIAVFALIFIEAGGIPLPGEIMLITAAAYAGTGNLRIDFVIEAAALGAVLGFGVSYTIGRLGGRAVLERYGPRFHLHMSTLDRADRLFHRYGDLTVFFGRFVAILRAWAAFLAGINRMPIAKFIALNVAGGVTWAVVYGILAFEFGKPIVEIVVRYISVAIVLAVVVAVLYIVFVRRRRGAEAAE